MMKWLKANWFYLVVLVIALVLPLIITNRYYAQVITMSLLFAIGALSLNLIMGYTGQASLAHGGFFAIGAYGVAILTYTLGWNFWLALPASALLAAFIGFLVGMPALRTRGVLLCHYVTMCLGRNHLSDRGQLDGADRRTQRYCGNSRTKSDFYSRLGSAHFSISDSAVLSCVIFPDC